MLEVKRLRSKILLQVLLFVMTVLFIVAPGLIGSVGFLMLISGAIAIGQAYYYFKREAKA